MRTAFLECCSIALEGRQVALEQSDGQLEPRALRVTVTLPLRRKPVVSVGRCVVRRGGEQMLFRFRRHGSESLAQAPLPLRQEQLSNVVELGWCRLEGFEDCPHLVACETDDRGAKQECFLELVRERPVDDVRKLPNDSVLDLDATKQHGA